MKTWKRLAAAVLAAVLVMAMLTACGGDAAIVVDKEQAKNVTTWVQEAMKEEGYTLTEDAALTPMINGGLPKAVAYRSAQINKKDEGTVNKAYNELDATLEANFAQTGKKGFAYAALYGSGATPKERDIKNYIKNSKNAILKALKEHDIETPKTVAVGFATQGDHHFILLVISE